MYSVIVEKTDYEKQPWNSGFFVILFLLWKFYIFRQSASNRLEQWDAHIYVCTDIYAHTHNTTQYYWQFLEVIVGPVTASFTIIECKTNLIKNGM